MKTARNALNSAPTKSETETVSYIDHMTRKPTIHKDLAHNIKAAENLDFRFFYA